MYKYTTHLEEEINYMSICTMNDYKDYSLTNVSRRSLLSCRNECYQEVCFHRQIQQQERGNKMIYS